MTKSFLRAASAAILCAVLAPLAGVGAAEAQTGFNPSDHPFAALAVSSPPRSTAVAITVVIPRGSSADDPALGGGMWLLGHIVRDQLSRRLAPTGSQVRVEIERDHTTFQVLALPAVWQSAYRAVVEEVFSDSIDARLLDAHRAELEEVFEFEKGAPVREFQSELLRMISDEESQWSRDPRGTAEVLDEIGVSDLEALRARVYRREESAVALVGDLETAAGIRIYYHSRNGQSRPLRPSGSGTAWSSGRLQPIARQVTNTWIGAGFPARKDASRTILEFLEARLLDELNPMPREPGLHGTEVDLVYTPDGPVFLVEATIIPEERRRWEDRVRRALSNLSERYDEEALFQLHLDHFRNTTLAAEGAPEVQGERIALDLLRDGRVREISTDIGSLTAERVRQTIRALGQPRVLVFGPDLP